MIIRHLSDDIGVDVLEDLVESKLEQALGRVAKERRRPAFGQLPHARLLYGHPEAFHDTAILARINLDAAFDEVERNDGGVSDATAEDASESAESKIFAGSIGATVSLND